MKLRTTSKYFTILYISLSILLLIMIIASVITEVINPGNQPIAFIIWICLLSVLFIALSFGSIYENKYGIISDDSLTIRNYFRIVKVIHWKTIQRVTIETKPSASSGAGALYQRFIVVYTDVNQHASFGGINKSKKGPWQFVVNEINLRTLNDCFKKYCKDNVIRYTDIEEELKIPNKLRSRNYFTK